MAQAYGAEEVVAFDPLPERRAFAQQVGIQQTLPPDAEAFAADRFADGALDLSIDCTGFKSAIQYLMDRTHTAVTIFGVLRETIEYDASHRRGGLATCALPFMRYAEGLEMLRNREAIKVRFLPWAE